MSRALKINFTQRLFELISEPEFVKFEHFNNEPNFFRIIGRAHFERLHSAVTGWLLDTAGSHLIGDYALKRLLLLLNDEKTLKSSFHYSLNNFFNSLHLTTFENIEVTPNENAFQELSVKDVGRFDVFVSCDYNSNNGSRGKVNILLELKVDSRTNSEQSKRYANWLFDTHQDDLNILIYLLPNLLSDSKSTVGDKRWYCTNYQLLNDKLLIPILDHPNLNNKVVPLLKQYLKNLNYRYKGIKMAITDEEKKLARSLYDKYSDVFDSIYDALQEEGITDYSSSDIPTQNSRASGRFAVRINNKIFEDNTVKKVFRKLLQFIVDDEFVKEIPLPWGTGTKRYILTNQKKALHPEGNEFFYPVSYKGYTIETHYSRGRAIKVLHDVCRKLKLDFELIEV